MICWMERLVMRTKMRMMCEWPGGCGPMNSCDARSLVVQKRICGSALRTSVYRVLDSVRSTKRLFKLSKTIGTRDSLVVTDQTTKRAIRSLRKWRADESPCILRSMADCEITLCCSSIYMTQSWPLKLSRCTSWHRWNFLLRACHSCPSTKPHLAHIVEVLVFFVRLCPELVT